MGRVRDGGEDGYDSDAVCVRLSPLMLTNHRVDMRQPITQSITMNATRIIQLEKRIVVLA